MFIAEVSFILGFSGEVVRHTPVPPFPHSFIIAPSFVHRKWKRARIVERSENKKKRKTKAKISRFDLKWERLCTVRGVGVVGEASHRRK